MNPDAQELWNSFREILRDANFFPPSASSDSVDETLRTIKSVAREIAPEDLRVIDQDLLTHRKTLITPRYLQMLAEMRQGSGLVDLSFDQLRARELDHAAVLKPVDLLSFPHPEVRIALLTRFGPASSVLCLRDMYDLDASPEVKAELMHVVNRRLSRAEVLPEEKKMLLSFAEEVLAKGFYHGKDIAAAKAAHSILRNRDGVTLPEPIRGIRTVYWTRGAIEDYSPQERAGIVHLYGDFMAAPELLEHIMREDDLEITELLLHSLELNWDLGVTPAGVNGAPARSDFSKQVLNAFLYKLGLEEVPPGLRDDLLRMEPREHEPEANVLFRRLALRALAEIIEE